MQSIWRFKKIFQDFAAPDDIYPYSIDEGFIDLTSSLNYFVPDKSISRKDKLDIISAAIQKRFGEKQESIQRLVCLMPIPY